MDHTDNDLYHLERLFLYTEEEVDNKEVIQMELFKSFLKRTLMSIYIAKKIK